MPFKDQKKQVTRVMNVHCQTTAPSQLVCACLVAVCAAFAVTDVSTAAAALPLLLLLLLLLLLQAAPSSGGAVSRHVDGRRWLMEWQPSSTSSNLMAAALRGLPSSLQSALVKPANHDASGGAPRSSSSHEQRYQRQGETPQQDWRTGE
jgi:hypothetical protein